MMQKDPKWKKNILLILIIISAKQYTWCKDTTKIVNWSDLDERIKTFTRRNNSLATKVKLEIVKHMI